VQQVKDRTHSTLVMDSTGAELKDPSQSLSGGTKVTIPGLRWHTAIAEDTRGQVATQHGIAQALLEQANGMPASPPTTPVPAGTLLLIPLQ
jgi:hypothetical protein